MSREEYVSTYRGGVNPNGLGLKREREERKAEARRRVRCRRAETGEEGLAAARREFTLADAAKAATVTVRRVAEPASGSGGGEIELITVAREDLDAAGGS